MHYVIISKDIGKIAAENYVIDFISEVALISQFKGMTFESIADYGYYRNRLQSGLIRNITQGYNIGEIILSFYSDTDLRKLSSSQAGMP